ncbi:hypothetical protein BYT27DRAFT_6736891 [Phlegmacium glaucopus]|nr:hypothetical protein BYT27DRAFT_6736891 [Phlegmacium glaucopus]
MVQLTLSMFIAALVAAPALARYDSDIESRGLSEEDVFGRELSDDEMLMFAREVNELFSRVPEGYYQDESLVGRGTKLNIAKKAGK